MASTVALLRPRFTSVSFSRPPMTSRPVISQAVLDVLDGAMVVLAVYSLIFFHPARLLKKMDRKFASGSTIAMMHKDVSFPDAA